MNTRRVVNLIEVRVGMNCICKLTSLMTSTNDCWGQKICLELFLYVKDIPFGRWGVLWIHQTKGRYALKFNMGFTQA